MLMGTRSLLKDHHGRWFDTRIDINRLFTNGNNSRSCCIGNAGHRLTAGNQYYIKVAGCKGTDYKTGVNKMNGNPG